MRILRIFSIILLFFLFNTSVFSNDIISEKSENAVLSDNIYNTLIEYGHEPKRQLLENALSTNFPYNIILEFNADAYKADSKKLVVVFPQSDTMYFEDIEYLINTIKNSTVSYPIDIVFTANDELIYQANNPIPAGSNTYIQNLATTGNIASIILNPERLEDNASFSFFNEIIEITPGGISSSGNALITPLSFFSTVINSFAKSGILYVIKGYFLNMYQMNLIKDDTGLGTWLENDIPAISISMHNDNYTYVFTMLNKLLEEFPKINFQNTDTNYSFIQLFSFVYFLTERTLLIILLALVATVLFVFFNLSFIKGAHKEIHKKELLKMWLLIPLLIASTSFLLFVSQTITQAIIPSTLSIPLFSFGLKILLATLLLLLFSSLQYITKLPITGFIYAYTLSLSAIINMILFSILEITLAPFFIGQYIIVQISQKARKVSAIIISLLLMIAPYSPLLFNIVNISDILNVDSIMHAGFGINILLAFFLLPFQIMIIRILTRLKLWGMRVKTNKKKIIMQLQILTALIIVIVITTLLVTHSYNTLKQEKYTPKQIETSDILITSTYTEQYENFLQNLTIQTEDPVYRYHIEIQSENTLPIYDSNYPYDILSKPFTAIFTLEDYPPNPLRISFTAKSNSPIYCKITAWIITENGLVEKYVEYVLQEES